jgi:broad specificity phosphatase PhoE
VIEPHLTGLYTLAAAKPLELPVTSFYFLRHGQTDGNYLKRLQPATQSLNETGLQQAREAAASLRGHSIQRIYASTMVRATQTAEVVGAALGLPVAPAPLLREKWFGSWVGQSSHNVDWDTTPPEGESLSDFVARSLSGISTALAAGDDALLVAHGGTLHVLVSALGIEAEPLLLANATPLHLTRAAGRWRAAMLIERDPDDSALA